MCCSTSNSWYINKGTRGTPSVLLDTYFLEYAEREINDVTSYLEEPKNKPKGPPQKGRGGKIKKW